MGNSAGDFYTATNGTFIGTNAYPGADGYTNITGIGYGARPSSSNNVTIGNLNVTSIGGYAAWSNLSDGRWKKNVNENVPGLEFIQLLRPVTYNLKVNELSQALKEDQVRDANGNIVMATPDAFTLQSRNEKEQIVYTGFIAQEVEQAAKMIGYNFSGVDAPKNEGTFYALRYSEFVVPLVKAVQQQQQTIEQLQAERKGLQSEVQKLKKDMELIKAQLGIKD
jgi:hypothetical protein